MPLADCTVCSNPGAWSCTRCGSKCAEHVRRKRGTAVRFICGECREPAELQRVRRSEMAPWRDRAIHALTTGMVGYPLLAAAVCGIFFSLTSLIDLLGALLGISVTIMLGLAVARAAADGEPFEPARFTDPVEDLAVPLGRGLATCWPVLVVVHVYVNLFVVFPYQRQISHSHSLTVTLLLSPWFWFAAISAVAYVPAALLRALTAHSWAAAFNPIPALKLIRRWQKEYRWLALIGGAGFLASLIMSLITPNDWLGGLFTGMVAGATGIALMRVAGELVYLHPDAFEWGDEDPFLDLADPAAPALEDVAPAAPARTATSTLEGRIRAALDAKDAKLAVELYREVPNGENELTQITLTRLGQAAASLEEYKLALTALLAASRENVPDSAKPLLLAAMIFDERLRDQAGAKRLYQQVIQRFPDTPAAERAKRELADPRFIVEKQVG